MAKKIVIANWKMNPLEFSKAKTLFSATRTITKLLKKTKVVIAPPFLFSQGLGVRKNGLFLGAQDALWGSTGAFTGEISVSMLKIIGTDYVICGHSERRSMGESDAIVAKKAYAVYKEGMTPVVCIGERERDANGTYLSFLAQQIRESLSLIPKKDIARIIIAYEPIWAIGKTAEEAMDSRKLHEMTIFIQKTLSGLYGRNSADKVLIIYGGSVEPKNAPDLIKNGNVSGFLVGHASLDAKGFGAILKAVDAL